MYSYRTVRVGQRPFLGQVTIPRVTLPAQSVTVTLPNIARPVGVRPLRAEFNGNFLYAASTSPILSVTVQ